MHVSRAIGRIGDLFQHSRTLIPHNRRYGPKSLNFSGCRGSPVVRTEQRLPNEQLDPAFGSDDSHEQSEQIVDHGSVINCRDGSTRMVQKMLRRIDTQHVKNGVMKVAWPKRLLFWALTKTVG
jgi:hypothetical protein